jgi:amino acid transporter
MLHVGNLRIMARMSLEMGGQDSPHRLQSKAVGLVGVLSLTLTGAAPMTAMLLNVPVAVGNGTGFGAPAGFLVATLVLLVFSVGYAAMSRKVTAVGGFYAFISHGLGRQLGMAMGFGSAVAYSVFEPAMAGGFAYFASAKILALTGINAPWPLLAIGMVLMIGALTYFDVKLSTLILGVALVAEVIVLLAFDIGIFGKPGGTHVAWASLNPAAAFRGFPAHDRLAAGAAGIGLFFAFWSWIGFEMAPNYGEESHDPKHIVPLSLYISVIVLGVLYTVTAWASVSAYGDFHTMVARAQTDGLNFFLIPSTALVGNWVTVAMSYLILTSTFAGGMAFHNTAARYFCALGREQVLPASLGRTHSVYKSPYVASFLQCGVSVIVLVLFTIFGGSNDANAQAYVQVYGLLSVLGTMLILAAQAIVSLAIVVYFWRRHPADFHWWTTFVAPGLAFLAQGYIIFLCIAHIDVVGGGLAIANWLAPVAVLVIVLGLIGATWLKMRQPERYDQVGRMIFEGLPQGALVLGEHAEEAIREEGLLFSESLLIKGEESSSFL